MRSKADGLSLLLAVFVLVFELELVVDALDDDDDDDDDDEDDEDDEEDDDEDDDDAGCKRFTS